MLKGNPKHYYGHNPAGALMVFTLFGLLALIFVSGLLSLGTIDFDGPLAFLANRVSDEASYVFRDLHHLLPPVALGLVVLHLLGVLVGSIQHKENLVRAMLTGKKSSPSHSNKIIKIIEEQLMKGIILRMPRHCVWLRFPERPWRRGRRSNCLRRPVPTSRITNRSNWLRTIRT